MEFFPFVLAMTGILSVFTAVVTSTFLRYKAKERGLTKGASRQELEEIRAHLSALSHDMHGVQETVADLTLMLNDSAEPRLPSGDDGV